MLLQNALLIDLHRHTALQFRQQRQAKTIQHCRRNVQYGKFTGIQGKWDFFCRFANPADGQVYCRHEVEYKLQ